MAVFCPLSTIAVSFADAATGVAGAASSAPAAVAAASFDVVKLAIAEDSTACVFTAAAFTACYGAP